LAKDRASSPDVKQFADMMIQDHTKAGTELKQIAMTYGIPTDVAIDDKHKSLMDKLSTLNRAEFDHEYMEAMVNDHQDAVQDLRSRVDEQRSLADRVTGKNPENPAAVKPEKADNHADASLNQWAANTLPTVERHLDRAKQIEEMLDKSKQPARATSGTNDKAKGASKY
jgi:putative membrane protein